MSPVSEFVRECWPAPSCSLVAPWFDFAVSLARRNSTPYLDWWLLDALQSRRLRSTFQPVPKCGFEWNSRSVSGDLIVLEHSASARCWNWTATRHPLKKRRWEDLDPFDDSCAKASPVAAVLSEPTRVFSQGWGRHLASALRREWAADAEAIRWTAFPVRPPLHRGPGVRPDSHPSRFESGSRRDGESSFFELSWVVARRPESIRQK